jgi:hypothetical protein
MSTATLDATAQGGLYKKLAEVMAEVGYVPKNGYNSFHKYNYVTEADLVDAVREKLAVRNVALIPSVVEIHERGVTTDRGKASTVTTVRVAFTFCDGDSGAMHKAEWAGSGDDPADKGLYKAYTGAVKYFLMKSFLIPTGDDPEGDSGTDERSSGGQRTAEVPPAAKVLSAANRAKVLAAVHETGIAAPDWAAYRTALGAATDAELTTEHAKAIRAWLDSRDPEPVSDIPSDVPFVEKEADLDADPDAPGGQFDLDEARAEAA